MLLNIKFELAGTIIRKLKQYKKVYNFLFWLLCYYELLSV